MAMENIGFEDRLNKLETKLDQLMALARYSALGADRILSFIYNDHMIRLYLPFADVDKIQQIILQHRSFFETRFLAEVGAMIPANAVVIDAGANIGNHTVFFSKVLGAAEVWAFEVMRETYRILERNIELNDLKNVRPLNVGLGAREGRANLSRFKLSNIGGTEVTVAEDGLYPIRAIDSFDIPKVDFIKIDVEGGQIDVLEGAKETLGRCKPLVWVEMRAPYGEVEPGTAKLESLGYTLKRQMTRSDFIFAPR
ncbi:FkbM family methyltransferase [Sphingomonas sp. ID0503]|uniref:FkbM family methyltransferase n=1 Tax=Sphingomonas sp. ID0503 TaxID=3399691 RepID=UPI003AFA3F35